MDSFQEHCAIQRNVTGPESGKCYLILFQNRPQFQYFFSTLDVKCNKWGAALGKKINKSQPNKNKTSDFRRDLTPLGSWPHVALGRLALPCLPVGHFHLSSPRKKKPAGWCHAGSALVYWGWPGVTRPPCTAPTAWSQGKPRCISSGHDLARARELSLAAKSSLGGFLKDKKTEEGCSTKCYF